MCSSDESEQDDGVHDNSEDAEYSVQIQNDRTFEIIDVVNPVLKI